MATYKGLPLNGGLDSPTGTGAENIVQSLEAIADWGQQVDVAGLLKDSSNRPSIDFEARIAKNASGTQTLDYGLANLGAPGSIEVRCNDGTLRTGGEISVDWNGFNLRDSVANASVDYANRNLNDNDGATTQLAWSGGLFMRNLPTTDPAQPGQLWNNGNVVNVSAG